MSMSASGTAKSPSKSLRGKQQSAQKTAPIHAPARPAGAVMALQRSAGNRAVNSLIASGQPLDPATRNYMEQRFSTDFNAVRVHTGGLAARAADSELARAYTIDSNIVFGAGEFAPNSLDGRRLLAHELAHVVQQTSRAGDASASGSAEDEAAHVGQLVAQGASVSVRSALAPVVQRHKISARRAEDLADLEKVNDQLSHVGVINPDLIPGLEARKTKLERRLYGTSEADQAEESRQTSRAFAARLGILPRGPSPEPDRDAKEEEKATLKRIASERGVQEKRRKELSGHGKLLDVSHPSFDSQESVRDLLVQQGAPAALFKRPLTGFELQLKADKQTRLTDPGGGLTGNILSQGLSPLVDPETGQIIGYGGDVGSDLTICDVNGNIVQIGDVPTTPSAVQPDEILFVGGALVKVGTELAIKGASMALRTVIPKLIMRRLRSVAAAAVMGTAEGAPVLAGRMAETAVIQSSKKVGGAAAEEIGEQVSKKTVGGVLGEAVAEAGASPAQGLKQAAGEAKNVLEAGGKAVRSSVGESASAVAKEAGAGVGQRAQRRAIWEGGRQVRGLAYESAMGKLYQRMGDVRRPPKNFKGIDYISGGVKKVVRDAAGNRTGEVIEGAMGISEKTLHLEEKSMQTAAGIERAIKAHIKKLYEFEDYTLRGIKVTNLQDKVLNIAIGPLEPTPQQVQGINDAIDYAKLNGIIINIFRF